MILDYYPFGLVMPGRSANTANPNDLYKFTGHERDEEAGLTLDYMNARNYDPITGRFLQIDPLSDQFPSWNPYHYVYNNPLGFTDPTGMAPMQYGTNIEINYGEKTEMAGDCPECRYAFSWLERPWNDAGQRVEQKSQEIKQDVAQATETVVKEGPEVLSDVSEASAIMSVGAATVSLATGIGPDDVLLAPAATGLALTATITDATASTLKLADALFYGGDMNQAVQHAVRTSTSMMMGGVYGGIISNVAKPQNQSQIKHIIKGIISSF